MPVTSVARFAADPDRVLGAVTDEDFLRDYAATLGTRVQSLESVTADGGPRTTVHLLAPTRGIAAVFSRFVGSEVAVVDRRTWTPDGAAGHVGTVDVRAEVMGRPVVVRGEHRLEAADGGTRSTVTGDAGVAAPLVGRQAEAAVRELLSAVLRRERGLLLRWLGEAA